MKTVFQKLNFGILSIFFKYFHIIITGKLLWRWFYGNKISESERDFGNFKKYLSLKISCYTVNQFSFSCGCQTTCLSVLFLLGYVVAWMGMSQVSNLACILYCDQESIIVLCSKPQDFISLFL